MSLQDVVARAIGDEKFRDALMRDPDKALADFGLSAEEMALFAGARGGNFESLLPQLEKRISKVLISPLLTPKP